MKNRGHRLTAPWRRARAGEELEDRGEEVAMDNGSGVLGGVPVLRRIRLALGASGDRDGTRRSLHGQARKDVDVLIERLARLQRSFARSPEVLGRVGLSSHVLGLFDEVPGLALARQGAGD